MQVLGLVPFNKSNWEDRAPLVPHLMQDATAEFMPFVFGPGLQQLIQTKAAICTLQQTREGQCNAKSSIGNRACSDLTSLSTSSSSL